MLTFAKVVRRLCQTLSDWTLLTSWNSQRVVAAGGEKLTAFLELELAIRPRFGYSTVTLNVVSMVTLNSSNVPRTWIVWLPGLSGVSIR